MKSNIKYIYDEKDNKIKKDLMDLIREKIKENSEKGKAVISPILAYELLIVSKYVIERDNLNVSNILDGDIDILVNTLKEEYRKYGEFNGLVVKRYLEKYKIYELLKKIIYEDYYIYTYNDRVFESFIEDDKKYLVISNYEIPFINHSNVDIFIKDISFYRLFNNKIYDEIVGINRSYYNDINDVNVKKYDYIIFINNSKDYISYKDILGNKSHIVNNILMISNYSNISKYRNRFANIKSILIDKDKAYIDYYRGVLFENREDIKICIKELTNVKDEDLKDIINTDKEIDNISIYVSLDDIRDNSYRIGFKAYNREFDVDRTKVLRLIDYNEKITKEIEELNKEISNEIDKLIVR